MGGEVGNQRKPSWISAYGKGTYYIYASKEQTQMTQSKVFHPVFPIPRPKGVAEVSCFAVMPDFADSALHIFPQP